MSNMSGIDINVELRHLKSMSPSHALKLIQILDQNDAWKFLMSNVPKLLIANKYDYDMSKSEDFEKKYTAEHIKLIENASKKDSRTPAEIFLFEWSHSGRDRPTLGHLFSLLKVAQLYRAADYLAINILNQDAPERPATGPAAKIDIRELDAELSDDDNTNIKSAQSNVTIENNLDNSKPQNTRRPPKLLQRVEVGASHAPTALAIDSENNPLHQGRNATATPSLNNSDERFIRGVPIVLQSPPESNANEHVDNADFQSSNRPDLSGLLGGLGTNSTDIAEENTSSSSEISDAVSSQMLSEALRLNTGTSLTLPQLSDLLQRANIDNPNSISDHLPNFSNLLHVSNACDSTSSNETESTYIHDSSEYGSGSAALSSLLNNVSTSKRSQPDADQDNSVPALSALLDLNFSKQ